MLYVKPESFSQRWKFQHFLVTIPSLPFTFPFASDSQKKVGCQRTQMEMQQINDENVAVKYNQFFMVA